MLIITEIQHHDIITDVIPVIIEGVQVRTIDAASRSTIDNIREKVNQNLRELKRETDMINSEINELKSKRMITDFERIGDLVALGKITGLQYFNLKNMLNAADEESATLAKKLIVEHEKTSV